MAAKRICSEYNPRTNPNCKRTLQRASAKTCSDACRNRRARRLKKQRTEAGRKGGEVGHPDHLKPLADAANGNAKQIAHEILKEEMKPIVREAITEDVLQSINDLVALAPKMVTAIQEDLDSDDKYLRQKAYSLLARYTLGNSSVAPPPTTPAAGGVNVTFLMPRPGDTAAQQPALPAEAVALKECVECRQEKPETEFVGASPRCQTCHDELLAVVQERFGA